MRIVLVHPTGSNWVPGKKDITATANRMAPLGLLSIAAWLDPVGCTSTIRMLTLYLFYVLSRKPIITQRLRRMDLIISRAFNVAGLRNHHWPANNLGQRQNRQSLFI